MTVTAITHDPPRELAHRESDGLEVTLFWYPPTNRLTVCVRDHRHGAHFEIEPDARLALETFYHPYSYVDSSVV